MVLDLDQVHGREPVSHGSPVVSGARASTEDESSRHPEPATIDAASDALAGSTTLVPEDGRTLVLARPLVSSAPRARPEATTAHVEAFPCGSDDGVGAEVTRLVEPRHASPAMREAGAAGGTTTDPCSSDPAIAATMGRESITATGPT